MTAQDLSDLQAAGWDIASHSVTHPSMISLSTTAARNELQNSKSTLTGLGLTIDSFVWPYGATGAFAQSAREIRGASPYVEIENEPAPKLIVDPPLSGGLAQGIFQAQYRVENVRIYRCSGRAPSTHLHVSGICT